MSIEYTHFICFAENSVSSGQPAEFECRNAISRAYYAAYHKAVAKLDELKIPVEQLPNAGSHKSLIEAIRKTGAKGAMIADDLNKLKKNRHVSDYKLSATVGLKVARKNVEQSVQIISRLDEL